MARAEAVEGQLPQLIGYVKNFENVLLNIGELFGVQNREMTQSGLHLKNIILDTVRYNDQMEEETRVKELAYLKGIDFLGGSGRGPGER